MARVAFGERLSFDERSATYRFAVNPDSAWDGLVVIIPQSLDDSYVVGSDAFPFAAQQVLIKAVERYELDGTWPTSVRFRS